MTKIREKHKKNAPLRLSTFVNVRQKVIKENFINIFRLMFERRREIEKSLIYV